MTFRLSFIRSLLYLYPAGWRAEFGPELEALLAARPLTPAVVQDVFCNALSQGLRQGESWKICAGVLLAWTTAVMVWNSLRPLSSPEYSGFTYSVLLMLFAAGYWTTFRRPAGIKFAAEGVAKAALISTLPDILVSLLGTVGVLHPIILDPSGISAHEAVAPDCVQELNAGISTNNRDIPAPDTMKGREGIRDADHKSPGREDCGSSG